jgi:hypothetical protein
MFLKTINLHVRNNRPTPHIGTVPPAREHNKTIKRISYLLRGRVFFVGHVRQKTGAAKYKKKLNDNCLKKKPRGNEPRP